MTREEAIDIIKCLAWHTRPDEERIEQAIKALEQEPCGLDDAREAFMHDVYNTLDFLPTNNEANRIIDSFDRVTSGLEQESCEDVARRLIKDKINTLEDIASTENSEGRWVEYEKCCYTIGVLEKLVADLEALPPVTLKEKTGHWFVDERPESDREVVCSNCDQPIFKYHKLDFDYRPKYCPNCGVRMVKP